MTTPRGNGCWVRQFSEKPRKNRHSGLEFILFAMGTGVPDTSMVVERISAMSEARMQHARRLRRDRAA